MNDKLRVGVVGSGVGQAHVHAFLSFPDLFEVIVMCDVNEANAREIMTKYNIPRFSNSLDELGQMDDLDVIDLCTPSFLHFEQVLQVLAADKYIICEKPVAGSLREIDALIQAEAQSNKRVMPIFQKRFGRGVQRLKFLVDQGMTGQAYLTTVETAWRRRSDYYSNWRGKWDMELGGALVTLAIHAHDLLYYILGPARRVYAHTATLVNPIETEDCAAISLEMADGSLAALTVTTGSVVEISRHRFCFSNLVAESNLAPYRNTCDPWTFTGDTPELQQQIEESLARFVPLPEEFEGQFYHYYYALQNNTELPVTLVEARDSLELITAIYHSAETGQPVELPLGKDHPKYANWRPFAEEETR
jgi:predicted dehydrogenase